MIKVKLLVESSEASVVVADRAIRSEEIVRTTYSAEYPEAHCNLSH